jgi:hypothetical protein
VRISALDLDVPRARVVINTWIQTRVLEQAPHVARLLQNRRDGGYMQHNGEEEQVKWFNGGGVPRFSH